MISETKVFSVIVGAYLSPTIGSEMFFFPVIVGAYLSPTIGSEMLLSYKLVWVVGRYFITRESLEYDDFMITECRPITDRIFLCMNKDMAVFIKTYQYRFVKYLIYRSTSLSEDFPSVESTWWYKPFTRLLISIKSKHLH